jgi:transcription antitermination factor NusG
MTGEMWSVLHVIANHEKRVAQHLAVRSLDHYLPLYEESSRWTERTVRLQRPLFPGYLFVRFAAESKFLALTAPGVLKLLGDDRRGMVSATEVERIRLALAEGYPLRPHTAIAFRYPGSRHQRHFCRRRGRDH